MPLRINVQIGVPARDPPFFLQGESFPLVFDTYSVYIRTGGKVISFPTSFISVNRFLIRGFVIIAVAAKSFCPRET